MTEQDLIFFSVAGGWLLFCLISWWIERKV